MYTCIVKPRIEAPASTSTSSFDPQLAS